MVALNSYGITSFQGSFLQSTCLGIVSRIHTLRYYSHLLELIKQFSTAFYSKYRDMCHHITGLIKHWLCYSGKTLAPCWISQKHQQVCMSNWKLFDSHMFGSETFQMIRQSVPFQNPALIAHVEIGSFYLVFSLYWIWLGQSYSSQQLIWCCILCHQNQR